MKKKQYRAAKVEVLSKTEKKAWDSIIDKLVAYFDTQEGQDFYNRFVDLTSLIAARNHVKEVVLTDVEERALRFIGKERKKGRSPTVREVSKALGCRSSRSGHKVVNALRNKKLL